MFLLNCIVPCLDLLLLVVVSTLCKKNHEEMNSVADPQPNFLLELFEGPEVIEEYES